MSALVGLQEFDFLTGFALAFLPMISLVQPTRVQTQTRVTLKLCPALFST